MQNIINQLSNVFTDLKKVTKSHILSENALIRIDIPVRQSTSENESKCRWSLVD